MRRLAPVVAVTVLACCLAGCGAASTNPSTNPSGSASGTSQRGNPSMDPVSMIKDGTATVIDVRTPEEFATGHVKGARNIDVQGSDFGTQIDGLPKDKSYVVYCRSGNRSGQALEQMVAKGFTTVVNGGGFDALRAAGVETE